MRPNHLCKGDKRKKHYDVSFPLTKNILHLLYKALFVCMRACLSVCYTNPQFSTDFDKTWYEASLGAGAEQGQVANALGRTAQQLWNPKKMEVPY